MDANTSSENGIESARFPAEIRLKIFREALRVDGTVSKATRQTPRNARYDISISMFLLNKETSSEALEAFYAVNTIRYRNFNEFDKGVRKSPKIRRLIHHVHFSFTGDNMDWVGCGSLPIILEECFQLPRIQNVEIGYDMLSRYFVTLRQHLDSHGIHGSLKCNSPGCFELLGYEEGRAINRRKTVPRIHFEHEIIRTVWPAIDAGTLYEHLSETPEPARKAYLMFNSIFAGHPGYAAENFRLWNRLAAVLKKMLIQFGEPWEIFEIRADPRIIRAMMYGALGNGTLRMPSFWQLPPLEIFEVLFSYFDFLSHVDCDEYERASKEVVTEMLAMTIAHYGSWNDHWDEEMQRAKDGIERYMKEFAASVRPRCLRKRWDREVTRTEAVQIIDLFKDHVNRWLPADDPDKVCQFALDVLRDEVASRVLQNSALQRRHDTARTSSG